MVDPAGGVEVVGCRHDRRTGSRQPAQLLRHAIRRIGVEPGRWFIQQHKPVPAEQRPGPAGPLALQVAEPTVRELVEAQLRDPVGHDVTVSA
jgi:hypothetical protein